MKNLILLLLTLATCHLQAQNTIVKEAKSNSGAINITVDNGGKGNDTQAPVIKIYKPSENAVFSITQGGGKGIKPLAKITVKGNASDASGVPKVIINGSTALINPDNGDFSLTLKLPTGTHTFTIEAKDKYGNIANKQRKITVKFKAYVSPEIKKHNLYVLSIGISEYENAGKNGLYNLKYADDDAQSIGTLFNTMQGVLFKNVYKQVLTNQDATRLNILTKLDWLEKNVSQGDIALIFVSSHGYNNDGKAYLMPYDGQSNLLRATAIDFADINETLMRLSNKNTLNGKVLFMADACRSGGFGEAGGKGASRVNINEALQTLNNRQYGVMQLLSSTGTQISWEFNDIRHGAFTYAILQALKYGKADTNGDFIISFDELVLYVKNKVKTTVKNENGHIQQPVSKNPATIADFPVFVIK